MLERKVTVNTFLFLKGLTLSWTKVSKIKRWCFLLQSIIYGMIFAFVLLMGKKYKLLIESDGKLLFSPRAATVAGATAALGITVSTNIYSPQVFVHLTPGRGPCTARPSSDRINLTTQGPLSSIDGHWRDHTGTNPPPPPLCILHTNVAILHICHNICESSSLSQECGVTMGTVITNWYIILLINFKSNFRVTRCTRVCVPANHRAISSTRTFPLCQWVINFLTFFFKITQLLVVFSSN